MDQTANPHVLVETVALGADQSPTPAGAGGRETASDLIVQSEFETAGLNLFIEVHRQ